MPQRPSIYEIEDPDTGDVYEVEADQMPSADRLQSILSTMRGGERQPARPWDGRPYSAEEFMEPESEPEYPHARVGRWAREAAGGAWEMVNPVTLAKGVWNALPVPQALGGSGVIEGPVNTGRALVGAQVEQFGKARQAFEEGRYSEAAGHTGAGMLPIVGPMAANIGERAGEGDIAGAAGNLAGALVPVTGAAKLVKKIPPKALTRRQLAALPAEQAEAVKWALDQGIPVDAATASGNRVARAAKWAADSTAGGAIPGQRAATARAEAMSRTGRDLASRVAEQADTAETAGTAVRESVEGVIKREAEAADTAYGRVRAAERAAQPDDVPVSRRVASDQALDRGFFGHWLADDLEEIGYQRGGTSKAARREAYEVGGINPELAHRLQFNAGAAGTPTQSMFHAAGVSGSRAEIARKIRDTLSGKQKNPRVESVLDAAGEAWDGQRFDWDLLTDDTLAKTGLKRSDFKAPASLPSMETPGASRFFGEEAAGLRASGTEPMQLAVPLASAKESLRPVYERLMRKKELTGQLMGDEGRAVTALDAIISGPDHAPLSVVDAALGDLKSASRGAALPELRTSGQGVAAQAVKELEGLVQARAKEAGVWDDLQAGRQATISKWTAAETLDKLKAEPVQTFRMLTQQGDAAIERLRDVKKLAPGEVSKVGRAFVDDLLDRATAEGGFGREASLWADWQKLGPETKQILFPDKEVRGSLDKFFLVGRKMAENPNPSGSALVGGLTSQGFLTMIDPASSAATAIGGYTLSKLLNSPRTARLLVDGMQTPVTATAARSLSARLRQAVSRTAVSTAQATQTRPREAYE